MAEDPPVERPEDWSSVGAQLFLGMLGEAAKNIDPKKVGVILADTLGPVLGALATLIAPIGTGLAKGIADAEDIVAPQLAEMAATAVGDMFGIDVSASTFTSKRRGAGSGGAGEALGAGFLKVIEGQGGPLEPGDEAAKRYLGAVLNMAFEGWWQGFFFEFLSSLVPYFDIGKIESFADLDDTVSRALGLGRLSRRVLGPVLDATVVTPLRWKVNKQYTPELLSAAAAVRAHIRGDFTREQLNEELARQGFDALRTNALIRDTQKGLSTEEAIALARLDPAREIEAVQWLRSEGTDESVAILKIQIDRLERIARVRTQIANAAVAEFINGEITDAELQRYVTMAIGDPEEALWIVAAAQLRRELGVKHLPASRVRQLVLLEVLSVVDFRRALRRENFAEEAIAAEELALRMDLQERRDRAAALAQQQRARIAEEEARAAEKREREAALAARQALPALTEYRRAYIRGIISRDRFAAAVVRDRIAITDEDLAVLLEDADVDRASYLEQLERRDQAIARQPDPTLSLAALEQAVVDGILTLPEFDARLAQRGYDDDERRLLTALLQARLEDRDQARQARDAAAQRAAARAISLPEFERAVRMGVRTSGEYATLLETIGTPEVAKQLLLDLLSAELQQDAAARQKRQASDAAAAAKGISLAARRRAVLEGLRPRSYYEQALRDAGILGDDQLVELALLDLEIAAAAAADARRASMRTEQEAKEIAAAAAADARAAAANEPPPAPTLSLAQLERAVKLGRLPPDALRAELRARAYGEEDVELYVALVVAAIPETRTAQQRETAIAGELAARRLSLADLQQAVLAGIRTLEEYEAQLVDVGYGADDVLLLRMLLADRIALERTRLETQLRARLAKLPDAPRLEEILAAVDAGELTVDELRQVLEAIGVDGVLALLYARMVGAFGTEG